MKKFKGLNGSTWPTIVLAIIGVVNGYQAWINTSTSKDIREIRSIIVEQVKDVASMKVRVENLEQRRQ